MTDTITRIIGLQPVSPSDGWRVAAVWDEDFAANETRLARGFIPFIGWQTTEETELDARGRQRASYTEIEPAAWYDEEVTTLRHLNDIGNFAAALVVPGEEPDWGELERRVLDKSAARLSRKATQS